MIIKCKECQVDVSDSAVSCPNCEISFPGISDEDGAKIEKDSRYRAWLTVPAVLFFGPVLAVLYNVIMGQGEVAKEIFLMYWHIMATGALFYIFSEICRGISNWHNERGFRKEGGIVGEGNPRNPDAYPRFEPVEFEIEKCADYFEKVKDLAGSDPVEGGVIKEGRYPTITADSQFPRKARTNKVVHEKLGPGAGNCTVNCLDVGQIVDVYEVLIGHEWPTWGRVTKWHTRDVYPPDCDDTNGMWKVNGHVARWINMEDLDWVDEVDA